MFLKLVKTSFDYRNKITNYVLVSFISINLIMSFNTNDNCTHNYTKSDTHVRVMSCTYYVMYVLCHVRVMSCTYYVMYVSCCSDVLTFDKRNDVDKQKRRIIYCPCANNGVVQGGNTAGVLDNKQYFSVHGLYIICSHGSLRGVELAIKGPFFYSYKTYSLSELVLKNVDSFPDRNIHII